MNGGERPLWKLQRDSDFAEARLLSTARGLLLRLVMWSADENPDEPHVLWSKTFRDGARSEDAARAMAESTRLEMMSRGWFEVGEAAV